MRRRLTPDRLLEVGVIHRPHGLKGALTVYSYTRPAIGIAGYSFWWLGSDLKSARSYKVEHCCQHGKRILAELAGVTNCAQAALLEQARIWVPAGEVKLDEGECLWVDLIGCEVRRTGGGGLLGTVVALEDFGAQDILIVRTPENAENPGEWMLPFIKDVVLDVNMTTHCVTIDLPEGMDACFTPRS